MDMNNGHVIYYHDCIFCLVFFLLGAFFVITHSCCIHSYIIYIYIIIHAIVHLTANSVNPIMKKTHYMT